MDRIKELEREVELLQKIVELKALILEYEKQNEASKNPVFVPYPYPAIPNYPYGTFVVTGTKVPTTQVFAHELGEVFYYSTS